MKRAIELDEKLIEEATKAAAAHGGTLVALVEDAVREKLSKLDEANSNEHNEAWGTAVAESFDLPVFHGDGLQPGVTIDSWANLVELMDREDGPPGR